MDLEDLDTKSSQFGDTVFGVRVETKEKSSSKTTYNCCETFPDEGLSIKETLPECNGERPRHTPLLDHGCYFGRPFDELYDFPSSTHTAPSQS